MYLMSRCFLPEKHVRLVPSASLPVPTVVIRHIYLGTYLVKDQTSAKKKRGRSGYENIKDYLFSCTLELVERCPTTIDDGYLIIIIT